MLGHRLGFLPTILPSITIFNKLFPITTCPIQFFCLQYLVAQNISSPIKASISSFVFWSLQLTFSIPLYSRLSKASNLSNISCFIVQVTQPYSATGKTSGLVILFFRSFFKLVFTDSLVLLKANFAIPILDFTSSVH
jgi:hypothetical protein